jgi:hypothetical protein
MRTTNTNLTAPQTATVWVRAQADTGEWVPIAAVMTGPNRCAFTIDDAAPNGGYTFYVGVAGNALWTGRQPVPIAGGQAEGNTITLVPGGPLPFPAGVKQNPLPPFDSSDPGGLVHTTLPFTPPSTQSKTFWRGDFGGMTLATAPPYVPGANTTPPEMVMTFLLPFYTQPWQDTMIAAAVARSHTHFHLDQANWQSAGLSPTQAVALMQYVQQSIWYTSFWALGCPDGTPDWATASPYLQPTLTALFAAGAATCERSILVLGGELNRHISPVALADIASNVLPQCTDNGVDVWLHLTSNYVSWPVAGQSPQDFWQGMKALGVQGLCWQGDQTDPAGTMGAHLWDARSEMAEADPSLLVAAFELMATAELYGQCTEDNGCLRGFEMVCCPTGAPTPNAPPVAGYGNGGRMPDGTPL